MNMVDLGWIRGGASLVVDRLDEYDDIVNKMANNIKRVVRNYKGISKVINTRVRSYKLNGQYYIAIYMEFIYEKGSNMICSEFTIGESEDVNMFSLNSRNIITMNEVLDLIKYITMNNFKDKWEIFMYIHKYLENKYLVAYRDVKVIDRQYVIDSEIRNTYENGRHNIVNNIQNIVKENVKYKGN